MKTAYLDCIAGASGDMLLGALVDAGLPAADLEAELAKLHLHDFHLHIGKVSKNGFGATKVDVHAHDHAPERRLADLAAIVNASHVSPTVKERALRVFTRICEEEAAIHGMAVDEVHLHEVGGIDAGEHAVGIGAPPCPGRINVGDGKAAIERFRNTEARPVRLGHFRLDEAPL